MAASRRTRAGAARTELVIVRCRHSPAIPVTPSSRMKRAEKSAVNSSRASCSVKVSVRMVLSPTTSSDSASVAATIVTNVRVVRSLSSSARSNGFKTRPR